jgi:hypothetical protein
MLPDDKLIRRRAYTEVYQRVGFNITDRISDRVCAQASDPVQRQVWVPVFGPMMDQIHYVAEGQVMIQAKEEINDAAQG